MILKANMLLFLILLHVLVTSNVMSDPTNPLSDTGQAENLINSFLKCIVQSRTFPQQELSTRINAMKKTLISSWDSQKTPKEKSQSTTLTFASALADLTKSGSNPILVTLKKKTVQQCLQRATLEIEGSLNSVFVQEMMQLINALQEKNKKDNTQPIASIATPTEKPKSVDVSNSYRSPTGSTLTANLPPTIPAIFSGTPFPITTGIAENVPQIPLIGPSLGGLQDMKLLPHSDLLPNSDDFSNNFKTSFPPIPKISEYNNFGDSFSRNGDSLNNFQLPLTLQDSSFSLSSQSSFGNMDFSSNFSPNKNEFSSDIPNNLGLQSSLSNNFGLPSSEQIGGFQTNMDSFPMDFGIPSEFQSNFGASLVSHPFDSSFQALPTPYLFSSPFEQIPSKQILDNKAAEDAFLTSNWNSNYDMNTASNFEPIPAVPFSIANDFEGEKASEFKIDDKEKMPSTSQDTLANWNSNDGIDATLNMEHIPIEEFSTSNVFNNVKKDEIKNDFNEEIPLSSTDPFSTQNWNSNYDMDAALDLGQIPVDGPSTYDTEETDGVKNDFKDSLFLNIISSEKIMDFFQKVSRENADKFADKLENILEKTFAFKHVSSQKIYQKLLTSKEYPLDEYDIADSLASIISKDLNDHGILLKHKLIKTAEDTIQAIDEAISQSPDQFNNGTNSKSEETNQEKSTSNKLAGLRTDSEAITNANVKLDSQSQLDTKKEDEEDTKQKEFAKDDKNFEQKQVGGESKKNSIENLKTKFITLLKNKIFQSGILKTILTKKQAVDFEKLITNICSYLANKFNVKFDDDSINLISKKLSDAIFSNNEETIADVLANFTGNELELQQKLNSDKLNDIVDKTFECFLLSLSDLSIGMNIKSLQNSSNQNLTTTKPQTDIKQGFISNKTMIAKEIPNTQKRIISEAKTNADIEMNNKKADISANSKKASIDNLSELKSKTTLEDSSQLNTPDDIQVNSKSDKKFSNQSAEKESNQKIDTETKLLKENNKDGAEANKSKDLVISNDSKDSPVSNNDLKENFINSLKTKFLETNVLDELLRKNLNEEKMNELSELYSKLLAEKFQMYVDNNKKTLISKQIMTLIKKNSDYQNNIRKLAEVTADILIAEDKLHPNNLQNVLDLTMQCAVETFSHAIDEKLSIDQKMKETTGSDIKQNTEDINSRTSLIEILNYDLETDADEENKSSMNNKTPKKDKIQNADITALDKSNIDMHTSEEYETILEKKLEGMDINKQLQKGNVKTSIDSASDLEGKNLNKATLEGKLKNIDSAEISTGNGSKSSLISLLKTKAEAIGIYKNIENIQIKPEEVATLIETYSKILSDKLKINLDEDSAMSLFMEFLNSRKKSISEFINTLIVETANALTNQGKVLENIDSISNATIQCLLEAVSKSLNLQIDTISEMATTIKTQSEDSKNTNNEDDIEKSISEDRNDKSKDKAAIAESTIMATIQKSIISNKADVKQSDDILADIAKESKLNGQMLKKENSNSDSGTQDASLFQQISEEKNTELKQSDDTEKQMKAGLKLELQKDKGISELSTKDVKENFASQLKAKIAETGKLNDLLKTFSTNGDVAALSKLYAEKLSEKLQIELNDNIVEMFIAGFLNANKTADGYANVLSNLTADIMAGLNILTDSSLNMIAKESIQCLMLSLSQLLNLNENSNIKAKLNIDNATKTSKSTELNSTSKVNSDFSLKDLIKSNVDTSTSDQNADAKLTEEFDFEQELLDKLDAQANIQDKNQKTTPLNAETNSDANKNSATKLPDEKDELQLNSDTNNKVTPMDVDNKQDGTSSVSEATSQPDSNSKLVAEIKQKLAIDLAIALASSEEFRLSVLTADLEDIMMAFSAAIEAVCGEEASETFLKTFKTTSISV